MNALVDNHVVVFPRVLLDAANHVVFVLTTGLPVAILLPQSGAAEVQFFPIILPICHESSLAAIFRDGRVAPLTG